MFGGVVEVVPQFPQTVKPRIALFIYDVKIAVKTPLQKMGCVLYCLPASWSFITSPWLFMLYNSIAGGIWTR